MNEEPGRSEEAAHIRHEMEQTRAEMGRTLGELQERLSPDTLKRQAKDAAYDATIGRVGNMVQRTGNGFVQGIKDNPLPAAIAALSVGWLFMRSRSQRVITASTPRALEEPGIGLSERAEDLKERAGRVAENAQEQIRARGREVSQRVQSTFDENPLAIGLGVVAVGIALGLAFPSTRAEDEWMGQARDKLVDKAQQAARGALDKADEMAQQQQPSPQPPNGAITQT